MARACVLLAHGFEEIEATTAIDVLRRAEVDVSALGVTGESVRGSHGITIRCDALLSEGSDTRWDAVVLPGGMPGAANLRDNDAVLNLLRRQDEARRVVAAICAAPIVLSKAGILEQRKATSFPAFQEQVRCAQYLEAPVVVDGHVLTSRGAGTAMAFALKLTALLRDEGTAAQVAERMLVAHD